MSNQHLVTTILFAVVITLAHISVPNVNASDNLEALPPNQTAFAQRTLKFLAKIDAEFFDRVEKLNGGLELETQSVSTEFADYDTKVARGPVVEKVGRAFHITKKPQTRFQKQNLWSRYHSFDVHPKTPLVGMLHTAFVIQFYPDGSSTLGGFLDILPGATSEEDLAYLRETMDEVYAKYGIDGAPHRELSCQGHVDDDPLAMDNRYRRRTACVGGSFFSNPGMMDVTEKNFNFMTEAYERFIDAYMTLIEKRKDDPYTVQDIAAQDAMRRNWLEDMLFSDPFTTNITPYEVWSLSNLPPAVKF